MSIKAFPGQPADLEGNRVECSHCPKLAFTRIGPFMTIAMVREELAKPNGKPGEPRCIAHLNNMPRADQIEQEEAS